MASPTPSPPAPRGSYRDRLRRLWRALGLVWESSPGWTVASAILVTVQGLLPLAQLLLLKWVLDAITERLGTGDLSEAFPEVVGIVVGMGGVSLLSALAQTLGQLVAETQAQIVAQHVHEKIHAKSLEVDLDYYENPAYFDTYHRAQQEAGHRPIRILTGLFQVSRSAVSFAGIAGLLFALQAVVGVLMVVALLPGIVVRLRTSGVLFRWHRSRTEIERRANYFDWLITSPFPAQENRLFHSGDFFRQRFRELRQRLIRERFRIARRRFSWEAATQIGAAAAMIGAYALVARRALQNTLTIGDVAMYFQAFQRGQAALRELLGGLASLYEDSLFVVGLDEFLALEPRIVGPAEPVSVPRPLRDGIRVEGLRFRYPTRDEPVLDGIDLSVRRGEMVALVGENGSGKTTLVKLLCRLYDPDAGSIQWDGTDIRSFDPTELRRAIGVVFQEFGRYQLSAMENIGLGDPEPASNLEAIQAAARRAGAHEAIEKLPRGYDTPLGLWFEEGAELSVGQWQRVALARAYLHGGDLVILDEPTSALDPRAEVEVFAHLKELARDRAAVVISHRFSTVRMADRIYVMEAGRIAESGTHEELVQLQGRYANLFETQARAYR